MRIARRYNGPATSANGGVASGRLAEYVGAAAVQVTLRRPPPLDVDLRVDAAGGTARLLHGDALVAEAVPGRLAADPGPSQDLGAGADPGAAVTVEQGTAAEFGYAGLSDHPFPTCFVCGTERDDGLGLRPGPLGDGRVGCVWTPAADDRWLVWAALDCPGGWSTDLPGRPMVLGRMILERYGAPSVGEPHVVVGWTTGTEGRKTFTGTALFDGEGAVVARAQATWIALAR